MNHGFPSAAKPQAKSEFTTDFTDFTDREREMRLDLIRDIRVIRGNSNLLFSVGLSALTERGCVRSTSRSNVGEQKRSGKTDAFWLSALDDRIQSDAMASIFSVVRK
jgi:hypothetical protein